MEVFEFEEDFSEFTKPKYLLDEEIIEDRKPDVKPKRRCGHGTDLEPEEEPSGRLFVRRGHTRELQMLSQSVPMKVPPRFATPSQRSGLVFNIDDDDDEKNIKFEKPHELAAKTYQEQYIKTGLEWDVPSNMRYNRKGAYSFTGK